MDERKGLNDHELEIIVVETVAKSCVGVEKKMKNKKEKKNKKKKESNLRSGESKRDTS
ncbi:hypothetical protein MTR_4g057700 [Medicago truncatula]|uniref:Uncharacterized protein n=1 Tax=Medicago truncatula TaxID=3880 RepID=A0A072UJX0_MEDTR|nr:hypothetical protein MTR_4g057700 [Medicago truncatula]